MESEVSAFNPGTAHSVQSFVDSEPGFTEGSVRWIVFRHKDTLLEKGAIYFVGRKMLIDSPVFISCLKEGLAA
jgi:hypothetical protein